MTNPDIIYYGGPEDFSLVNTAYLQLDEELEDSLVMDACDYIRNTYGNELTVEQMESVFADFDIDYPNLRPWNKDRFDDFDIVD